MVDWLIEKYGKLKGKLKEKLKGSPDRLIPFTTQTYDEYVDLIANNEDDPETLREIATGIGLNPNLTDAEKDALYELIDECLAR